MKRSDWPFVFDANAIVSASLSETSTSAEAFYLAFENGTILLSEATLHEISEVLNREKFDQYVSRDKRRYFLHALIREAELIETYVRINECRDSDDGKYLELVVDGKANCIVSGDKGLLALNPFRNIPIMRPSGFLDWIIHEFI